MTWDDFVDALCLAIGWCILLYGALWMLRA